MRRRGLHWLAGLVAAVLIAVVVVVAAGTGGSSDRPPATPFAWLHPAPPPGGWQLARTPSGATLAYPPGWRTVKTDPGTASAALAGPRDGVIGYLNATPQAGGETLANWGHFRPSHNADEGDRGVRVLASSPGLEFRTGRGSCVIDSYSTTRASYREIACLVAGAHATTVVVAAARSDRWSELSRTLQRAVSSFAT